MLTLVDDRYAWNRQLSVSVEIPLLWVVLLTWFLGRLSGVGSWRVGLCWDLRCRRQMGICWGISDTFGNTREIHHGKHYSALC